MSYQTVKEAHPARLAYLVLFHSFVAKTCKMSCNKNAEVLPDLVVFPRIPQKLRISGSLSVILVVFLLTAVLVKVKMEPLPFFAFTMIKIICINCEYHHHHHHHHHLQGVSSRPLDLSVVVFSVVFSPLGRVTRFGLCLEFIMSKRWLEFTHTSFDADVNTRYVLRIKLGKVLLERGDVFLMCFCVYLSLILTMVFCFAVSLSAAFGAILQGSLFGLAGMLPASYTTPIMSGQGLAGTFAAVSMICALACMCSSWSFQIRETSFLIIS